MNNSFKIVKPTNDKYINIPVEINFDFFGRDDSIEIYENDVVLDLIGIPNDFEICKFSHKPYPTGDTEQTRIQYTFHFFSGNPVSVPSSTPSNWVSSYLDSTPVPSSGFLPTQIYYFQKPFTRSFFKLDFYDSNVASTQTNYFTVILPVQQGLTQSVSISPLTPNVDIKTPNMILDFVGDKEGFFFYWLRKRNYLNITTFYMTAKFFDARIGEFVRMMTVPQVTLPDRYRFDNSQYFYYKVVLNYSTKTYEFFNVDDTNNQLRIGDGNSLNWYEYVNPV